MASNDRSTSSSESSDDSSSDGTSCKCDSSDSDVSFAEDLCISSIALSFRADRLVAARMKLNLHVQLLLHENLFHVKYQMSLDAFNKLLDLLTPVLCLKEQFAIVSGFEPICNELMLHCAICYLAGGSYHDIRATAHISKPSFFRLLWHTMDAINSCQALAVELPEPTADRLSSLHAGFKNISYAGVMDGCVGVLDGYLMQISAPSQAQCGNVTAYFLGHYCSYGVNLQAMCDADCCFTFFSIAAPGKTKDNVATKKTSLPAWLESLPPGYFIAADCAYSVTEHLVTPYYGPQCFLERNDNLNFFLSQLHIRIETAFGLLVTKWRILHTPINVKFSNLRKLVSGIITLHNYCINNQEEMPLITRMYKVAATQQHPHEPSLLGYIASDAANIISREGVSHLQEILTRQVANNNLEHLITAATRSGVQQWRLAMYERISIILTIIIMHDNNYYWKRGFFVAGRAVKLVT
jgi:hypothetical protein